MFQAPADQLHDGVFHQLAALLRLLLLLLIHSPVPSDQESHNNDLQGGDDNGIEHIDRTEDTYMQRN